MNSIKKFILELNRPQSQISIPVMLGDTAREWHISFSDDGKAFHIEDGVLAQIEIKRPTGTKIEAFCDIVNNTTVVYDFNKMKNDLGVQTAIVEGIHPCDILLYDLDGGVIASAHFTMVVANRVLVEDDHLYTDEDFTKMEAITFEEANRQDAEGGRADAEGLRVEAEDLRVANETQRIANEESRKTRSNELFDDMESTIAEVEDKLKNGKFDGEDGDDGFSPLVSVSSSESGSVVSITDKDGTKTFTVANGERGKDGAIVDYTIEMSLNKDNYVLTLNLKDANGNVVKTSNVDFPIENVIVSGREENDEIILTLVNGNEVRFSVAGLVDGLVSTSVFETKTTALEKEIADLKYVPISITSFGANPPTAEKGSTVTSVVLSWGTNKTPTTLTFDGQTIDATAKSKTVTGTFTSNKTWALEATDERGAKSKKSATLSFLNGVYYGVATEPSVYDSAFILGLMVKPELRSNKTPSFSVDAGDGQYVYYCLPTEMGTCSFSVNGFDGGFSLIATTNLKNVSGYTEEYYIYRSDNVGLGQTTVLVS